MKTIEDAIIKDVTVISEGEQIAFAIVATGRVGYVVTPIPACGDKLSDYNVLHSEYWLEDAVKWWEKEYGDGLR